MSKKWNDYCNSCIFKGTDTCLTCFPSMYTTKREVEEMKEKLRMELEEKGIEL